MALFSEEGIRFFRRLGKVSLVALAVAAAGTLVFWRVVRHREQAAEAAWAALDSQECRPAIRFSSGLTNATAVGLQVQMAEIGLDPLPAKSLDVLWRESYWSEHQGELHGFLEESLEQPGPAFSTPPRSLSGFLRTHENELAAMRASLADELPPRWAVDLESGQRHQAIHFLALTGLGEWFLVDALESRLLDRTDRAAGDLEAAWGLVELLLERPEVHAQASALFLARGITGTLRKVEGDPIVWGERLHQNRFRTGLQAAIVLWGEGYLRAARWTAQQPFFGRRVRRERMFWKIYGRLWYRYSMADASLQIARELEALRALGDCSGKYRDQTRLLTGAGDRLTATGRLGLPDYGIQWTSLMQLRAEMELTRKILLVRSLRGADGSWPAAPPGIESSECPEMRWVYTVASDGSMSLTLEGALRTPSRPGALDLPMSFQAPGPPRNL